MMRACEPQSCNQLNVTTRQTPNMAPSTIPIDTIFIFVFLFVFYECHYKANAKHGTEHCTHPQGKYLFSISVRGHHLGLLIWSI